MVNIFEFATRYCLRFPYKGNISTEDLWYVPLKDLDGIFKTLNEQLKTSQEESLLTTKSEEEEMLEIKIQIVKHVFTTRQQEIAEKLQQEEQKKRKQKILEIMEAREDKKLEALSDEELAKELAALS